jgi:multicomponent Na+:H+ antiporter subunit F
MIDTIASNLLFVSTITVMMTMLLAIVRAFMGPSVYDRILAVNMFGTKTVILIGVLGYLTGRPAFLDIALVYALMNFITTIAVLRYSDFVESPEPNPYADQEVG